MNVLEAIQVKKLFDLLSDQEQVTILRTVDPSFKGGDLRDRSRLLMKCLLCSSQGEYLRQAIQGKVMTWTYQAPH